MALGIIGAVVGAAGSLVSGMMAAQQSQQQAAIYERQAAAERAQAAFNAQQQEDKAIKIISSQRTAMLGAGVSLAGTPSDVLLDTTRMASLDNQAIKYNGEIKAQNFEMQAQLFRSKAAGQQVAGAFGAISPLIKGFGGGGGGGGFGGGDFSFGGSSNVDEG
jgi:uncharacterized membrane protein YgcG